ncbi:MAG: 30S ribosomal protein S8 [Alphaproteobacteria bacterium]|nr:30S ribosomal protein S8 [Alphaproteobacteria bacterium]
MSMSDPLGDLLTRIRNGQHARKTSIECPWAKLRENVCKVLQEEGYIRGYKVADMGGNRKTLVIDLKYEAGEGVIRKIQRVSKPGRRMYTKVADMPRFYNGLGVSIVSTPKGVLSDSAAREQNVGGEILCQVY